MPMQEYEHVKGFTFVQSTEPAESISKEHDTWYNTSNNKVYMFQNYRWKMYVNAIYFPGADYGYVCGGSDGTTGSTNVDRFSFPFDSGTSTKVGNITGKRHNFYANNSSDYSFTYSGYDGNGYTSIIDRFSFPFDSGTATHVGNLSGSNLGIVATNSSNYGYACSGIIATNTGRTTIDRITFPFDSGTAVHVGNMSGSQYYNCACNSSNYSYMNAGFDYINESNYTNFSTIERFEFPFDSGTASHVGNLNTTRQASKATSCNSSNYGFVCGGQYYDASKVWVSCSFIDRFSFPFDSGTASHVGNLNTSSSWSCANNSTNYGYVCGGYVSGSITSMISRIEFPFNSGTSTHVGNLSSSRTNCCASDGTDFVTQFDNLSSRVYV